MQLSTREQAVKQHMIDQLRGSVFLRQTFVGLSYAEKKHIDEELDRDFVESELQNMRSRARRTVWWFFGCLAALAALRIYTSYASGDMTHQYWKGLADMLFIAALSVTTYTLYLAYKARLFIYEGLRILASTDNEAAQRLYRSAVADTAGA